MKKKQQWAEPDAINTVVQASINGAQPVQPDARAANDRTEASSWGQSRLSPELMRIDALLKKYVYKSVRKHYLLSTMAMK